MVADGYMKQTVPTEYKKFIGEDTPQETHADNVALGKAIGLVPVAAWTSSDDEWDEFEWGYQQIVEEAALKNPDDAERQERLGRRREWMDAYLQWGRDTLGYGTYLFRKP